MSRAREQVLPTSVHSCLSLYCWQSHGPIFKVETDVTGLCSNVGPTVSHWNTLWFIETSRYTSLSCHPCDVTCLYCPSDSSWKLGLYLNRVTNSPVNHIMNRTSECMTCGCYVWSSTLKIVRCILGMFTYKVLRRLFGPRKQDIGICNSHQLLLRWSNEGWHVEGS
jgi:hypothetical protein